MKMAQKIALSGVIFALCAGTAYGYTFSFTNLADMPVRVRIKHTGSSKRYETDLRAANDPSPDGKSYDFAFKAGKSLKAGFCLGKIEVQPFNSINGEWVPSGLWYEVEPYFLEDQDFNDIENAVADFAKGMTEQAGVFLSSLSKAIGLGKEAKSLFERKKKQFETYFGKTKETEDGAAPQESSRAIVPYIHDDAISEFYKQKMGFLDEEKASQPSGAHKSETHVNIQDHLQDTADAVSKIDLGSLVKKIGYLVKKSKCKSRRFYIMPNIDTDGDLQSGLVIVTKAN